jgi:hypothetical protein
MSNGTINSTLYVPLQKKNQIGIVVTSRALCAWKLPFQSTFTKVVKRAVRDLVGKLEPSIVPAGKKGSFGSVLRIMLSSSRQTRV